MHFDCKNGEEIPALRRGVSPLLGSNLICRLFDTGREDRAVCSSMCCWCMSGLKIFRNPRLHVF